MGGRRSPKRTGPLGLSVLIIEDNPDHALLTQVALERHPRIGSVTVRGDAESALTYLAEGARPDAVLVDLKLPGLSGFDLIDRIRAAPDLETVPVVILSTSAREDEIALGLERGARGFLTKPIRVEEFLEKVDRRTP